MVEKTDGGLGAVIMGCYGALLGNSKSAQVHLLTSFKMDPTFRDIAKKDPDLESVKELI